VLPTRELIEVLWLGDEVQMATAPELIEELVGVLERDYITALIRPAEGQVLLDIIHQEVEILPSFGEVPSHTRDPKKTTSSLLCYGRKCDLPYHRRRGYPCFGDGRGYPHSNARRLCSRYYPMILAVSRFVRQPSNSP
jgi:hypothetical protein